MRAPERRPFDSTLLRLAIVLGAAAVLIGLLVSLRTPAGAQTGPPPQPGNRAERLRAAMQRAAEAEARRRELHDQLVNLMDKLAKSGGDRGPLLRQFNELKQEAEATDQVIEAGKREAVGLVLEELDAQVQ